MFYWEAIVSSLEYTVHDTWVVWWRQLGRRGGRLGTICDGQWSLPLQCYFDGFIVLSLFLGFAVLGLVQGVGMKARRELITEGLAAFWGSCGSSPIHLGVRVHCWTCYCIWQPFRRRLTSLEQPAVWWFFHDDEYQVTLFCSLLKEIGSLLNLTSEVSSTRRW